jgi:mannose-6-phosphate isomerase-like protein (cupin superfamily)
MNNQYPAVVEAFSLVPLHGAIWRPRGNLLQRELGLTRASKESMSAHHYRANGAAVAVDDLSAAEAPFLFAMVLSGEVKVTSDNGSHTLQMYDTCCRYGSGGKVSWEFSHTAEILLLQGKVSAKDVFGAPSEGKWSVTREKEDAYIRGDGPRTFFSYRDLETAAVTDRRIHIQLVRAAEMMSGGTGWHFHSMGQIFYILRGWGELVVEDAAAVRMSAGDAMCISPGMRHNVPGFSRDYFLLEMCVPADYSTVDAPPPEMWAQ